MAATDRIVIPNQKLFPKYQGAWIVELEWCQSIELCPLDRGYGSWTALRKIILYNVQLQAAEWKTVIEAIDLSDLQHLNLYCSNITHEAFKLFVDRIPGNNTSKVPFKTLDISYTGLAKSAMLVELRKKAPLVKILD
ncbi:hypothetical protein BGZ65_003265 [Modicella reniformis]|uniref:Uncharacterized protein n=1 Tax=Modicella reniformis TaxID=1440133 RepID=A0A9P6M9C9_9FUNG|nr:hypothetical protein BGZ65_003265 [Modicella reniformis]